MDELQKPNNSESYLSVLSDTEIWSLIMAKEILGELLR
jgi:hypothetical protein